MFDTFSGSRQFDTFSVDTFDTFSGHTFDTFSIDLTHLAALTHCLCSCSCCIHNVLLTVEHFQFFAKEFFAMDSRWWNSIRAEGGHMYYRQFP